MWKILAAFVVFAGAAMFFLFQSGDKIDMQGEAGHGTAHESSAPAASTPTAPEAGK
ncbi:MAG: hypothetical protein V4488_14875 [Pseudomonadota bacterium]